jgi:hypothetical protein
LDVIGPLLFFLADPKKPAKYGKKAPRSFPDIVVFQIRKYNMLYLPGEIYTP